MIGFIYQKTAQGWGVSAGYDGGNFTFSGTFDRSRINQEKFVSRLNVFLDVILWSLLAVGVAAAVAGGEQAFARRDFLFLFRPAVYNQVFWISFLTTLYLWARNKQRQLDQTKLNILKLGDISPQSSAAETDVYGLFNKPAKRAWNRSLTLARQRGGKTVSGTDLFLSLLEEKSVEHVFWRLGVSPEDIKKFLKNYQVLSSDENGIPSELPFAALQEALKLHNKAIDPLMLLCALAAMLSEEHIVKNIFFNLNVDLEKLEAVASWLFNVEMLASDYRLFKKLSKYRSDSEINKGLTSVPTFYLDRYSQDLTRLAKHGALPLTLGRGDDLHEIFKLFSSGRINLLIKGPVGAGRTTLVNELAYKMASEQVPAALEDKRLVKLELSALVSGRFKAETAFVNCLNEAAKSGNIVLVLEDVHVLAKTQTSDGLSLLEVMVNFLESSDLSVIATTTLEDYTDYLRPVANFDQLFLNYELIELSRQGILLAACIRASILELQDKCFFRFSAIEQAVQLTDLYVKDMSQPQKAIAVLVEAATKVKNNASKNRVVTEELVQKIVSEKTHIPTQALSESEQEKLLNLEDTLTKYIVGQQAAVRAVAEGLRRARSGLSSGSRPLASFLFLGPTGVGKTEIAKTLAKVYFGDEKYMLRVDMSEFRGPDAIEKFLGTEGRKTDTPIIKHLKNYPFCLLLLDEYEKASPEIINLFLQILEDGRLTSGRGELLDLTQTLIIATSNAGTREIQEGMREGKTLDQIRPALFNRTLPQFFPPELLNRFDGVILFSSLSPEEVEKITTLQLSYLTGQLLKKGIVISFTQDVASHIAHNAFDASLGARPIRRYIQDNVESFVAKLLLSKKLSRGSNITVTVRDGELTVQ